MNKTGVDDKAFSEIKGKGFFVCPKLRKGVTNMAKELKKGKILKSIVVDANTGEIKDRIYEGDKITRGDDVYHNFNKGKPFVKLYHGISLLRKQLTDRQFSLAIALADFVCYEDCCLKTGGHYNGKPMTNRDIAEALDENYNTIREIMRELKAKEVLGAFETGGKKFFTVNPWIYTRGTDVNKTVMAYFKDSIWAQFARGAFPADMSA